MRECACALRPQALLSGVEIRMTDVRKALLRGRQIRFKPFLIPGLCTMIFGTTRRSHHLSIPGLKKPHHIGGKD